MNYNKYPYSYQLHWHNSFIERVKKTISTVWIILNLTCSKTLQVTCSKQGSKSASSTWKPCDFNITPPPAAPLWWANKIFILFVGSAHGKGVTVWLVSWNIVTVATPGHFWKVQRCSTRNALTGDTKKAECFEKRSWLHYFFSNQLHAAAHALSAHKDNIEKRRWCSEKTICGHKGLFF